MLTKLRVFAGVPHSDNNVRAVVASGRPESDTPVTEFIHSRASTLGLGRAMKSARVSLLTGVGPHHIVAAARRRSYARLCTRTAGRVTYSSGVSGRQI
jgi:hypothetical protein